RCPLRADRAVGPEERVRSNQGRAPFLAARATHHDELYPGSREVRVHADGGPELRSALDRLQSRGAGDRLAHNLVADAGLEMPDGEIEGPGRATLDRRRLGNSIVAHDHLQEAPICRAAGL